MYGPKVSRLRYDLKLCYAMCYILNVYFIEVKLNINKVVFLAGFTGGNKNETWLSSSEKSIKYEMIKIIS